MEGNFSHGSGELVQVCRSLEQSRFQEIGAKVTLLE